jgi:uncharacterized protein YcfJ
LWRIVNVFWLDFVQALPILTISSRHVIPDELLCTPDYMDFEMKKTIFLLALASLGLSAGAQEVGKVLSSTQVIQQVAVPRQVCTTEQVAVQPTKSGAGAAMGAIAGGTVGNAMGGGSGKVAATMLGIFGGAILGDKIEGPSALQTQIQQRCTTQNILENRIMGYNVTYEFAGKQYNVQLPSDPGPTIKLQITPALN